MKFTWINMCEKISVCTLQIKSLYMKMEVQILKSLWNRRCQAQFKMLFAIRTHRIPAT